MVSNKRTAPQRRLAAYFSAVVERLEERALFIANVLVNNPALDLTTNDTQSESTTIQFGTTVLVAYNDSGSRAITSNKFTGWSRSTDSGATFADMGQLPTDNNAADGITGDAGDPVLARDSVSGAIYFATLAFTGSGTQVFKSIDGGATFGAPVNGMTGFTGGAFLDRHWMSVDNFAGAGQGNVYLASRNFPGGLTAGGMYFSRSTDAGATFSAPVLVASDAAVAIQGANVLVAPDHSVYVFWLEGSNLIKVRKSTDRGLTFAAPVTVVTLGNTGTNGTLGLEFRTNAFVQTAVNPVSGNLYAVVNNDPAGVDRGDIVFTQSTDGGATWTATVRVNNDPGTNDQYFPTVSCTPNGTRLFVGWQDRRGDSLNKLIDVFGTSATISGAIVTFGPNFRITNTSFNPSFGVDPAINSTYRGDYDTSAADNTFVYYSWSDDRDNSAFRTTKQQNMRFAKFSVNGPAGPIVIASRPSGTLATPFSNVQFDFSTSMNQASFAVADINSFTGPSGNLLPQVTGFTWIDADTLQVNFAAQATDGTYTIDIGPNILSLAGQAMDQDISGVAGTASDNFTTSFSFVLGIIYGHASVPFENINLVPGAPGVVTILDGVDDGTASIPLGTDTFRFYKQNFTGSNQLFVSSNGLITFGAANLSSTNTDLTSTPTQRSISPLWDNWLTTSATDQVLYFFDSPNNRLIIEWNDVISLGAGGTNGATWQAILQLNTGTANGDITFNYVDLDVGNAAFNNGLSSTVGIKDLGTQGTNRDLISFNAANSLVGNGLAVREYIETVGIWTGLGDGVNWSDALNWSNNTLPGASDDVYIGLVGNPNIQINIPVSVRSITSIETLTLSNTLALTRSSSVAALNITNGGAMSLSANGDRLLKLTSLAITGSGRLDLNDNDMILDYTGATPRATLQAYINAARNGGVWTGNGLTSTSAKNRVPRNTTLGVLEATEFKSIYGAAATFDSQDIDNTALLVKYTYYGDTDFNGAVEFDDFVRTDAGFNLGLTGWLNGDSDSSGGVEFDDYVYLDLSFNTQSGVL